MGLWDELVGDGWKAAKGLIDEHTEIDNILAIPEGPSRPPITPHYTTYQSHLSALESINSKLQKQLQKFRLLSDTACTLLFEAVRLRDPEFALVDRLWVDTGTWTLEHFVESMQDLPTLHASHLAQIITLTSTITHPNGTSNTSAPAANTDIFELQRSALQLYADATTRSELHFWREEWLELVGLEIGGWESNAGGSDEGGSVRKGGRSSRAGSVDPGI